MARIKRRIELYLIDLTSKNVKQAETQLNEILNVSPHTKIELTITQGTSPQLFAFIQHSESETIEEAEEREASERELKNL